MAEKNYYDILGVNKDASDEDIKKQFRKLANKWHPDRFATKSKTEQKEAESKMKDINEAYSILSDKEKRQQYDNPSPFGNGNPFEGFNPFGFDFNDLFGGRARKQEKRGSDLRIGINITISELLQKTTKTIKYNRQEGDGKTCPHCGGTGQKFEQRGHTQYITPCHHCNGTGISMKQVSHECTFVINGVNSEYDVQFNPSTNVLSFIMVIPHEGNKISSDDSKNGDLIVEVRCQLPFGFKVEGSPTDITFDLYVPVLTAIVGGNIEFTDIEGVKLNANIPQGTSENARLRFGGKGLMSNGIRGNMYGIVHLKMPKTITQQEKEILEQLKDNTNFK